MYRSSQSAADEGCALLGILFLCFFCSQLPFIIANLVFASQGSECVTTHVTGISFTLQGWLQVDAYVRIIICAIFLLALFSLLTTFGLFIISISFCLLVIYSLFTFAWTIVGAVLFWGKLSPLGVCDGSVSVYMHALLILSFIMVWFNCFCNRNSRAQ